MKVTRHLPAATGRHKNGLFRICRDCDQELEPSCTCLPAHQYHCPRQTACAGADPHLGCLSGHRALLVALLATAAHQAWQSQHRSRLQDIMTCRGLRNYTQTRCTTRMTNKCMRKPKIVPHLLYTPGSFCPQNAGRPAAGRCCSGRGCCWLSQGHAIAEIHRCGPCAAIVCHISRQTRQAHVTSIGIQVQILYQSLELRTCRGWPGRRRRRVFWRRRLGRVGDVVRGRRQRCVCNVLQPSELRGGRC